MQQSKKILSHKWERARYILSAVLCTASSRPNKTKHSSIDAVFTWQENLVKDYLKLNKTLANHSDLTCRPSSASTTTFCSTEGPSTSTASRPIAPRHSRMPATASRPSSDTKMNALTSHTVGHTVGKLTTYAAGTLITCTSCMIIAQSVHHQMQSSQNLSMPFKHHLKTHSTVHNCSLHSHVSAAVNRHRLWNNVTALTSSGNNNGRETHNKRSGALFNAQARLEGWQDHQEMIRTEGSHKSNALKPASPA